jgi:hypothetical protein
MPFGGNFPRGVKNPGLDPFSERILGWEPLAMGSSNPFGKTLQLPTPLTGMAGSATGRHV